MREFGITFVLLLLFAGAASAADERATVRILPSRTYVVCERRGAYDGISEALAEVAAWVRRSGLTADGSPIAVLYDDPETLPVEKLRYAAWIPVKGWEGLPREPEGRFTLHTERPRLALVTKHRGPLSKAEEAAKRLGSALEGRGLRSEGTVQLLLGQLGARGAEIEIRLLVSPAGPSDVLVYADEGAWGAGLLAISDALSAAELSFRPLLAGDVTDGRLGKRGDAILFPGGWAASYKTKLGEKGAGEILRFVERGGGYLGICAGAFFAAKRIRWEGEEYDYPLDLFPGKPDGAIDKIAPWPGHALTDLRIAGDHPVVRGLGKSRKALYFGGPTLDPRRGEKVSVLATYGEGGAAALVAFRRGRGRVVLSGVHPEIRLGPSRAQIGWPEEEVDVPDPESDRDLFLRAVRWTLGKEPVDRR